MHRYPRDKYLVILGFEQFQTIVTYLNPLSDEQILDWSKMKQIADKILKCIQNGK